ncbi:DUF1700 domain-containing protein [Parablautia muri]|uniref:DUF1700 domain-containing protein n=1 Tax=Parablautia muri TaxID=2320879 RepID=UPI00136BBE68
MTKQEFLTELQRALNGRMGSRAAAPHISYYQEYIEIEMRKGLKEEEVINSLGSPRLLGKSIGDAFDRAEQKSTPKEKAAGYGLQILRYGKILGRRCGQIGTETLRRAKVWFDRLN